MARPADPDVGRRALRDADFERNPKVSLVWIVNAVQVVVRPDSG